MPKRLTQLDGFVAEGDVLAVDWAVAKGRLPRLVNPFGWNPPTGLRFGNDTRAIVVITDELRPVKAGVAFLRPPSLVAGIHPSPRAGSVDIENLLTEALAAGRLSRSSLTYVATADHERDSPVLQHLGYPVRSFTPRQLDRMNVPNQSATLFDLIGTRSVCEAAALLAAGRRSTLLVERFRSPVGTIAIARRHADHDLYVDVTSGAIKAIARRVH